MQEMQGVMVIAATNRVDTIDTALLRPGRFDKIVYVPIPDKNTRFRILEIQAKGKPIGRDIDLRKIAEKTERNQWCRCVSSCQYSDLVLHEYLQKYPSAERRQRSIVQTLSY